MNATTPQTLLQMRGLSIAPARLSDAALVIIDAQGEYRSGQMGCPASTRRWRGSRNCWRAPRSAGTPIFHVAQIGQPGTLFDPTTERGAILPQAAPVVGRAARS